MGTFPFMQDWAERTWQIEIANKVLVGLNVLIYSLNVDRGL